MGEIPPRSIVVITAEDVETPHDVAVILAKVINEDEYFDHLDPSSDQSLFDMAVLTKAKGDAVVKEIKDKNPKLARKIGGLVDKMVDGTLNTIGKVTSRVSGKRGKAALSAGVLSFVLTACGGGIMAAPVVPDTGTTRPTTTMTAPLATQTEAGPSTTPFLPQTATANESPTQTSEPTETTTPVPAATNTEVQLSHELEQVGNFIFFKDELLGGDITINPNTADERFNRFLSGLWNIQVSGHNQGTLAAYGVTDEASFKRVCASGKKITGLMFPELDMTSASIPIFGKLVRSYKPVVCSKSMVGVIHRTDMPNLATAEENNWIFVESERPAGVMHLYPFQLPDGTIVPRLDISSYTRSFGTSMGWPIDPDPLEMLYTDRITKGMTADEVNLYAADAIFNTVVVYSLNPGSDSSIYNPKIHAYVIPIEAGIHGIGTEANLMWQNQLFQKR